MPAAGPPPPLPRPIPINTTESVHVLCRTERMICKIMHYLYFSIYCIVTSSQQPCLLRRLTDDIIQEIAVNRLTHQISKLGFAMGLPRAAITKYEAENNREPRTESRGTKNMIHDWREKCTADDQVEAFCAVLREAELLELADDLSAGTMMS